jgi:hypothetical protein
MQGFTGVVGQQFIASISRNPHQADPASYDLAASISSPHVMVLPLSAYGAKPSPSTAVTPSGQMMQGFSAVLNVSSELSVGLGVGKGFETASWQQYNSSNLPKYSQ